MIIICGLTLSGVTACAGHFSNSFKTAKTKPAVSSYGRVLQQEYLKIADFEEKHGVWEHVRSFKGRAADAASGSLRPLNPNNFNNARRSGRGLYALRAELERAMVGPASRTRPKAVAEMQAAYDCMVRHIGVNQKIFRKCEALFHKNVPIVEKAPFPRSKDTAAAPTFMKKSADAPKAAAIPKKPVKSPVKKDKVTADDLNITRAKPVVTPAAPVAETLKVAPKTAPAAKASGQEKRPFNPQDYIHKKLRSRFLDQDFGASSQEITNSVLSYKPEESRYPLLAPEETPLPSKKIAGGPHPSFEISFTKGGTRLTDNAKSIIADLAEKIESGRYSEVIIRGHSDKSGPASINKRLSFKRASTVGEALTGMVKKKVDASLITEGYGYDIPIVGLSPSDPRNRRAEVILVK